MAIRFNFDLQNASLVKEAGLSVELEVATSRSELLEEFPGLDASNIRALFYEDDRNLYHIVEADHNLIVCENTSDDPRMDFVARNIAAIEAFFQEAHDAEVAAAAAQDAANAAS